MDCPGALIHPVLQHISFGQTGDLEAVLGPCPGRIQWLCSPLGACIVAWVMDVPA